MSQIRFNLKSPAKTRSLIVIIFRHRGEKAVLSTGQVINPKYWDKEDMKAKGGVGYPESMNINHVLNTFRRISLAAIAELTRESDSPIGFSVNDVKQRILEKITIPSGTNTIHEVNENGLVSLIDAFIVDVRDRRKHKPSTIQGYSSLKRLIISYSKGDDLSLNSLDRDFYKNFQQWMFSNNLASNYVQKQWTRLKTVIRYGVDEGLLGNQDSIFRSLPVKKVDTDHIYLTDEEIENLEKLDLNENPRLARIRDIFLVGAFTGLRFCDLIRLDTSHIKKEKDSKIIRMVMKKTNREVVIPCKPIVSDILTKYGGKMPQISEVNYNRYLKELGSFAGLDEETKMRTYKGGQMKSTSLKKWERLTSHTARRSFATNLFKQEVSPVVIQKMTGHTNTKVLMAYIKMDGDESAIKMAGHAFFN